jgi:hypothetical protein
LEFGTERVLDFLSCYQISKCATIFNVYKTLVKSALRFPCVYVLPLCTSLPWFGRLVCYGLPGCSSCV